MIVKDRFKYIDALRGIAIAGVIITHVASILELTGTFRKITNIGALGVQLFFVISAFTIFYSLSKNPSNPNQNRDFFIRRLFRIIPIYWLGIILYSSIYGLGSRGWLDGPELWHIPYHVFLVNVLHPETSSSVVPGGWSISCEVLFYLTVPFLYLYLVSWKRIFIFMFCSLIIIPIGDYYLRIYSLDTFFKQYDQGLINSFFYRWLPNQLACFGFGIILFKIYIDGRYKKFITNKLINLLALGLVFGAIVLLQIKSKYIQSHHLYAFVFMSLALLLSVHPWKIFVNSATVFVGKISFSCYLIHFIVIKELYTAINKYFPLIAANSKLNFLLITILAFIFTVPLAYLSYRYLELTAVNMGKKLMTYLDKRAGSNRETICKSPIND